MSLRFSHGLILTKSIVSRVIRNSCRILRSYPSCLLTNMKKVYPSRSSSIDSSLSDSYHSSSQDDDSVISGSSAETDVSYSMVVRPIIVSVEGNIGCGKSTLLEYFKQDERVEAIPEPIDKWTNLNGHNLLKSLYQDTTRYSFTFNTYATLTRAQMHDTPTLKRVVMLERSLYSTRYCFVENDHRHGRIHEMEYNVLNEWFQYLHKRNHLPLDLIVYLRADPRKCYERLCKRNRKEEQNLPYSFIEDLHELHEEWLIKDKFLRPAPVLVLDANNDLCKMNDIYEENKNQILCS